MNNPDDSPLMTTAEVTAYLRVDPRTLRRFIEQGRLTVLRIAPRTNRYRRAEIEALGERGARDTTDGSK
jgi:excisionase family DNA binding protein